MEKTVLIAVKGGLSVIEKCLRDILEQTKTNSQSRNWLLKERHSDISPSVVAQLTSKAEEMLTEINELQKIFNVGKDIESVRWRIISDLTQVWTILSDLSADGWVTRLWTNAGAPRMRVWLHEGHQLCVPSLNTVRDPSHIVDVRG